VFELDGVVFLSASDLVGHLNCRYLTSLDLTVAKGERPKPKHWKCWSSAPDQRRGKCSSVSSRGSTSWNAARKRSARLKSTGCY
jgi:hypothetical protein